MPTRTGRRDVVKSLPFGGVRQWILDTTILLPSSRPRKRASMNARFAATSILLQRKGLISRQGPWLYRPCRRPASLILAPPTIMNLLLSFAPIAGTLIFSITAYY